MALEKRPKRWSERRDNLLSNHDATAVEKEGRNTLDVAMCAQCESCNNLWKLMNDNNDIKGYIIMYVDEVMAFASSEWVLGTINMFTSLWECKITSTMLPVLPEHKQSALGRRLEASYSEKKKLAIHLTKILHCQTPFTTTYRLVEVMHKKDGNITKI